MEIKKIDAVEEELSRFQRALKAIRAEHKEYLEDTKRAIKANAEKGTPLGPYVLSHAEKFVDAPKLTGSLKRSSMDLTRALAELRKP